MEEKIEQVLEMKPEKKKTWLSLIQPTGTPTIGNYFGAIKQWPTFQDEFNTIFGVADLHSITVRMDPKILRAQTLQTYALLLASGLDPDKSTLLIQSQVSTHAQLMWLLSCFTQFGELSRMTQFKEKSASHTDNVNAGLFTYPALMAADILLYQTDFVPVGQDQKQHLEIARDIAERFNGIYSNVFTVPEPYIMQTGARIMSLQDPTKKMSKSDVNPNGFVSILDETDQIIKKCKRAVTDSDSVVCHREGKAGINNLMDIYGCATGKTNEQIESEFRGKGYGDFKLAVGEVVADALRPLQKRFYELMQDKAYLSQCYTKSAQEAQRLSQRTLDKAMKKIGFIMK